MLRAGLLLLFLLWISDLTPRATAQTPKATALYYLSDARIEEVERQPALRAMGEAGAFGLLSPADPTNLRALGKPLPIDSRGQEQLIQKAQREGSRLVVLCDRPPHRRVGFIVVMGPGVPKGSIFASPSTHTKGLVTKEDVKAWLGGEPRAASLIPSNNAWAEILSLGMEISACEDASLPVLLTFAGLAAGSLLLGIAALAWPSALLQRMALRSIGIAACSPTAMLLLHLDSLLPVDAWEGFRVSQAPQVWVHVTVFLAMTIGLATLLRFRLRIALSLLFLAISVDLLFGSPLVSRTELSGYYVAGIRFYGMGNEYFGLLLGALLLVLPRSWWCLTGIVLIPLLGLPFCGADAGGAIVLAATLTYGLWPWNKLLLRKHGDMSWGNRVVRVAGSLGVAAFVAGSMALVEQLLPVGSRSHIGMAVAEGETRGLAALGEIVWRKLLMNLHLLLALPTLLGLAGLCLSAWLLSRGKIGEQVRQALGRDQDLSSRLPLLGVGAFTAFAFNDSGCISALLLLVPLLLVIVEKALCDLNRSMG